MSTQPQAPQSVTSRYVSNLLKHGSNDSFVLNSLNREKSDPVGTHFVAYVSNNMGHSVQGVGVTPESAVSDALVKHDVTFR